MGRQKKEKKTSRYRLTLVNDETHAVQYTVRFTKRKFFGAIALALCVLIGGCYTLLVFTPLRSTIPGYPDAHWRRQAISNAIKIDSLESEMTRWMIYSENLNRVLGGEQTLDIDSLVKGGGVGYLKNLNAAYARQQDSVLRDKVRKEEQFSVSSGAARRLPIEGVHFFSPLKGVISNGYDISTHPAVDITAPKGATIKAVLDGTVIFAGWSDEYGYTIQIQHDGDLVSVYKHNRKLLKKTGDKVSAGTPIAHLGNTGSLTTGDHLHFELWYKGQAVDPTKYISF